MPTVVDSKEIIHITSKCKGCDHCRKICPVQAIEGKLGERHKINQDTCLRCGQCLINCPFEAIEDLSMTGKIKKALKDPKVFTVTQVAPAVRVALGEEFGLEPGSNVKGKMFTALRKLGFDKVYDTEFAADLTIMEEGNELIERITHAKDKLPMFTSCCPAWIKYAEDHYPSLLKYLSTSKSPMQMFGAIAKTYGAEKLNVDPSTMFSAAVMPCTAKKYECQREEMTASGYQDVDAVFTTRELAQMIKEAGIDFLNLPDGKADRLIGTSTGAATIFGVTGGVMEAALRTAYEVITGKTLPKLEFKQVRGFAGIREATVDIAGMQLNVAIVTGSKNVDKVVNGVMTGRNKYHFVEVMNCSGGCINGGGQPIRHDYL
ncbi:[FeFe] hydrogenase, group A [Bacillus massiliigorillae]|uniref:[FeFe] hydrogenase, group A n=1 Tax=Bacillus massiliigorillae TaxID=1243664 RepID=UPI00039FDD31|nr:[FeFe] hydrogenase, group A [Bacillus massiliigorillae]